MEEEERKTLFLYYDAQAYLYTNGQCKTIDDNQRRRSNVADNPSIAAISMFLNISSASFSEQSKKYFHYNYDENERKNIKKTLKNLLLLAIINA